MMRKTTDRALHSPRRTGGMVIAALCAAAMVAVIASPIAIGPQGIGANSAAAAGNGNSGSHGKDSAPGQIKQATDGGATAEDSAIASVTGEGAEADGGSTLDQTVVIPIADEAAEATNKVIQEVAGIPEDSELSEQEELEAIQSGWGTWRTADGPETVIAQ